jgi:CheY-like chemotaxis protein
MKVVRYFIVKVVWYVIAMPFGFTLSETHGEHALITDDPGKQGNEKYQTEHTDDYDHISGNDSTTKAIVFTTISAFPYVLASCKTADAAPILSAYKRQFETQGVMIDACETYEEALELLKMRSYDVALMDVWQAGVQQKNALDLLRLLRERRPDVKIILMTGGGNNDAEKKAAELGASFYLINRI